MFRHNPHFFVEEVFAKDLSRKADRKAKAKKTKTAKRATRPTAKARRPPAPVFSPERNTEEPVIATEAQRNKGFARIRELLSHNTTEGAIEIGRLLIELEVKHYEYEQRKLPFKCKTGYKYKQLVLDPKMQRDDWERPVQWTICHQAITLKDEIFEAMVAKGYGVILCHHMSRNQLNDFVAAYNRRQRKPQIPDPPVERRVVPPFEFLNHVVCADCVDVLKKLPPKSVDVVITSPPYADQRKGQYQSYSEKDYDQWMCCVMQELHPALGDDASVLMVIRSHVDDGRISDYVMRTRLALHRQGWHEPEELLWLKTDGPPMGNPDGLRRNFEQILWFTKSKKPYLDKKACGNESDRVGFNGDNVDGIARMSDVFRASVKEIDSDVDHPAKFPPTLVNQLIRTFCPPGGLVLDMFAGSGTTILEARALGHPWVAIEIEQRFADMINDRLEHDVRYMVKTMKASE